MENIYICGKLIKLDKTLKQYDSAASRCKEVFAKKTKDYGTAWRILRSSSLTDQLFIKASRIRSIEELGERKVAEGVVPEYIGLVNYSIMALIQLELPEKTTFDLEPDKASRLYDEQMNQARNLMQAKNHDYGEVWREMRISSLTDLILMKLLRIKQIEDNEGRTLISEGLDANYQDIINYAIFALIRLEELEAID